VAHNVASSHVDADRRSKARQLVSIDDVDLTDNMVDAASVADRRMARAEETGCLVVRFSVDIR
jgi:hypothetical protein